ncbi:MAG: histidinol-phosphate transaminase [Acidobacteriaceae bacterium]|nr:histidinol-phosphate transaminase [Acidobacteriaceae bacterium]
MIAYTPGKSKRQALLESSVDCIKLASNENPFGPSPKAVGAMQAALAESNFYPDNDVSDLTRSLSERHGVSPENIVVAAGSTAVLELVARAVLSPGLNAVTSERSFIIYPIATEAAGGKLIQVPMRDNAFDLRAIATAVDVNTRIIYLANPNNPTGTLLKAAEIDRFLDDLPDHVVVMLDEAYHDFAEYFAKQRATDHPQAIDYVRQGRRVVVLRTFSKAHGLAGLRIGYGIGPAELMSYIGRMRTTFSVSSIAQAAAQAALDDKVHIEKTLRNNADQAEYLTRSVAALGCPVVPTWANFLFCELGEDAANFAQRIQTEGVIIRPLAAWGAPNAIRVTIGTPDQNQIFLAAFTKVSGRH